MTRVDIIAGFLGAGKTTLINKLLSGAFKGEKLALIENEFGEVGVDGAFLKGSGMEIAELDSGCICCSLAGDFTGALLTLCKEYAPDRILIEPSGVAAVSDVKKALAEAMEEDPGLCPGFTITVADAVRIEEQLASYGYGEVTEDQLKNADLIAFSRTGGMDPETLTALAHEIAEINPHAALVTTPWEALSPEMLVDAAADAHSMADELLTELVPEHRHHCDGHCGHHDHHAHPAEGMFMSWGAETPKPFTKEALETILSELDTGRFGMVLRAKGIVPLPDGGWAAFDYVPNEKNIRPSQPDLTGKLCVIGVMLDEKALNSLFLS